MSGRMPDPYSSEPAPVSFGVLLCSAPCSAHLPHETPGLYGRVGHRSIVRERPRPAVPSCPCVVFCRRPWTKASQPSRTVRFSYVRSVRLAAWLSSVLCFVGRNYSYSNHDADAGSTHEIELGGFPDIPRSSSNQESFDIPFQFEFPFAGFGFGQGARLAWRHWPLRHANRPDTPQ